MEKFEKIVFVKLLITPITIIITKKEKNFSDQSEPFILGKSLHDRCRGRNK